MIWKHLGFVATVGLTVAATLDAQPMPFLSEEHYRLLVGEISGDAAYEHIRFHTQFHKPRGGHLGLMEVARYYEARAREYGLEDVRLIKQKASYPGWEGGSGDLWLVEPELERLASTLQTQLHLGDNSRSADVTAELVDAGAGANDGDYASKDVRGKVVLAWGSPATVMSAAVWKRGALGLVLRPDPSSAQAIQYPDQVRWFGVPVESDGEPKQEGTWAFGLSHAQGVELAKRLSESATPVKVHARVDAKFGDSWQVMVEGFLRGAEIQNQDVVLTGHLQEEKFSANDDGSGSASTLEVGRALAKLVREGRLPRPRRSLRFWWTTEIGSERQFFADEPQEVKNLFVNVNQDMVGANQGQDTLRVQNVTRVPFSRFHFLNDVTEAVVEFIVRTNTAQLAMGQAGTRQPYSRPILSHLGTRHRYAAKMVPFHNNTDHMVFNEAPIGVPAVTFTNWPDNYIHTTDDDLWNIDRTQLQRNAFAVAAIAVTMANAGDATADALMTEVFARGTRRIAEAFDVGTRLMRQRRSNGAQAFRLATNQVEQAVQREIRALSSIGSVSPGKKVAIDGLAASFRKIGGSFQVELTSYYHLTTGEGKLPSMQLDGKERELEAVVPKLTAGPTEFLEGRNRIQNVPGLHTLMAFEILNFVDGRRTGLQIYDAVSAEALQAGSDYYGTVSPDHVRRYLDSLVAAGLVTLAPARGKGR